MPLAELPHGCVVVEPHDRLRDATRPGWQQGAYNEREQTEPDEDRGLPAVRDTQADPTRERDHTSGDQPESGLHQDDPQHDCRSLYRAACPRPRTRSRTGAARTPGASDCAGRGIIGRSLDVLVYLVVGVTVLCGLWAIDRLLVWAEHRGWVTYRLTPRPTRSFRGAAGSAMLGLDLFYSPNARHVLELKQEAEVHREADDEAGDGPDRHMTNDE